MASALAPITAAASCATCVFGATSRYTYSYTARAIETIDISVIELITTFRNAPNITNYETITNTDTIFVGTGGEDVNATTIPPTDATTFSDLSDITWTVGNATLTYPTTYIQYLGFAGATASNTECVDQSDATSISMPRPTDRASFIYPFSADDFQVPTPLLEYLGSLPSITEQVGFPEACQPLLITPTPEPSFSILNFPREAKRYEGARKEGPASRIVNVPQRNNDTHWLNRRMTINGTAQFPTAPTEAPGQPFETSPEETSATQAFSTSPRAQGSSAPKHSHKTAFVLNTITGRQVVNGDTLATPTVDSIVEVPLPANTGDTNVGSEAKPLPASNGDDSPPDQGPQQDISENTHQNSPGANIVDLLPSIIADSGESKPSDTDGNSAGPAIEARPPVPTTAPVFTVDGTTISANSNGNFEFGTQELVRGQTINVGSDGQATPVAMQTANGSPVLVVGGSTYQPIQADVQLVTDTPAVITADGQTYNAVENSGSIVFIAASSTFALAAGSASTIGNVQTSAAPDASAVVVDGITMVVSQGVSSPALLITLGSQTFSAKQQGSGVVLLVDRSSNIRVAAGSQTVINGQTISVEQEADALVVDGSTIPLAASATPAPEMTITASGGAVFTATDEVGSVILRYGSSTVTLADGSQTILDGHTLSALQSGNGLVIDGTTTKTFDRTATSTGVGDYINSGLGSNPMSTQEDTGTSPTSQSNADGIHMFTFASMAGVFAVMAVVL